MKQALAVSFVFVLFAGAALADTVTLTVHDYPAGDGPTNLASNGIPLEPGALFNDANLRLMDGTTEVPIAVNTLARWHGDNSIRSILVQFDASFAGLTKTYSLEIGQPRTVSTSLTTPTWDFPKKLITLPADYLCPSKIVWEQEPLGTTDFTDWEQKQLDDYHEIDYEGATLDECPARDQYYDTIHTSYQLYARTGDKEYLINGRQWALHHVRDQIYLTGDSIGHGKCPSWTKTRFTYIQGLVNDYFLWGGSETKDVAGLVADYFYMTHSDDYYYQAPGVSEFWTEREPAFALLGLITYYEATNDTTYLNKAKQRIDQLYQMQLDNGGTAWIHDLHEHDPGECSASQSWGVSPWMTGLLLEGIIRYHQLTGYSVAEQSILWALDYLKDNCLAITQHAGESFRYMCGCLNPTHPEGEPDLDNMISHAFAYGYTLTDNTAYKDVAIDIFNTCVNYAYTGTAKHYNQQFRASGHTVAYLTDDVVSSVPPLTTAPGLELYPNHPNPFNPQTTIRYAIPAAGPAKVGVYNVHGQLVRPLVNEVKARGEHAVMWNGRDEGGAALASGAYVVRLQSAGRVKTRKIVLLK